MGQRMVPISFTAHLPAVIIKKKRWYVSHCPVLDVASQGDTEEEAKRNLIEAVTLFLLSCYEDGVLDSVLKESGFVPALSGESTWEKMGDAEYIDVPLPFVIDMENTRRCHV